MTDPQENRPQPAPGSPGPRLWRRVAYVALGIAAVAAVASCGNGGSHTTASGVYYTAVATPAYYSGPGTPHAVPPGTPAVTVATPGATPVAPSAATPTATPGKP